MTTVGDIDAMMAESKALDGDPAWVRDDRGSVAHLAIRVVGSRSFETLTFKATAIVHEPVQSGSCVLVLNGRPVSRLSFRPSHAHINPLSSHVAQELRGLRLPAGQSRFYAWSDNRAWPRPKSDNVGVARTLDPDMGSLALALAIFLNICNIDGQIPSPPWEPRLL